MLTRRQVNFLLLLVFIVLVCAVLIGLLLLFPAQPQPTLTAARPPDTAQVFLSATLPAPRPATPAVTLAVTRAVAPDSLTVSANYPTVASFYTPPPPTATLSPSPTPSYTFTPTHPPLTANIPSSWYTKIPAAVNWPEPMEGLSASKLGINVAMGTDPWLREVIYRAHPAVITSPDDRGTIQYTASASPSTTITSRVTLTHAGSENWPDTRNPADAAHEYVTRSLPEYRKFPEVDYWEGWNEYIPLNEAHWHWYTSFEAARACWMNAYGLHAAVGGFSYGWPNTYQQMEWFLPALEAAHECGGILSMHEYNSPTFACGVMSGQPNIIPGAPALEVLAGYHTLRYRFIYEGLLKPRGLGDLPLVITELGIDGGQVGGPCYDTTSGPWKKHADQWVKQGFGPSGPQAYVNLLAWYDYQIREDPYVIGASIFTASGNDAAYGWYDFDLHDVFVPLATYAVHQR